jgi:hypothetical protein
MDTFTYLLLLSTVTLVQLEPRVSVGVKCGERLTSFSSNSSGLLLGREEDPADLSAPTQVISVTGT